MTSAQPRKATLRDEAREGPDTGRTSLAGGSMSGACYRGAMDTAVRSELAPEPAVGPAPDRLATDCRALAGPDRVPRRLGPPARAGRRPDRRPDPGPAPAPRAPGGADPRPPRRRALRAGPGRRAGPAGDRADPGRARRRGHLSRPGPAGGLSDPGPVAAWPADPPARAGPRRTRWPRPAGSSGSRPGRGSAIPAAGSCPRARTRARSAPSACAWSAACASTGSP